MNSRMIVTLLSSVLTGAVLAGPVQSAKETIAQFAAHARRHATLAERREAAMAAAKERDKFAQWRLTIAKRLHTPQQIADIKEKHEKTLARGEELRAILACAKIEDAEERAAKRKEVEAEQAEARKAASAAGAGFAAEDARLREVLKPIDEELRGLMAKVGRTSEELGIAKAVARANAGIAGTAGVAWNNAQGRTVVQLTLRLSPVTHSTKMPENVWKKFPLGTLNGSSVSFLVGHMSASFVVRDGALGGKEKIQELGETIMDLEALDGFRAARENDGELKRKLDDAMGKYLALHVRRRAATAEPSRRQNAARKKLQELRSPYSAQRVAGLELRAKQQRSAEMGSAISFEAASNDTPEQRRQARIKAEKGLEDAQHALKQSGVPFREEEIAQRRSTRRLYFHVWEMMDGVVRAPRELTIIESRIHVSPDTARVGVRWYDLLGKELVRGELHLVPSPPAAKGQAKVAGKYPVSACRSGKISFPLGSWEVELEMKKDEWKSNEKMLELAGQLLAVETIADWPGIEDVE